MHAIIAYAVRHRVTMLMLTAAAVLFGTVSLGRLPLQLLPVRRLLEVPGEVLEYFNHATHFDTKNAVAALEGTGVKCPHLLEYMPVLVEFFKANKHRSEYRWRPF